MRARCTARHAGRDDPAQSKGRGPHPLGRDDAGTVSRRRFPAEGEDARTARNPRRQPVLSGRGLPQAAVRYSSARTRRGVGWDGGHAAESSDPLSRGPDRGPGFSPGKVQRRAKGPAAHRPEDLLPGALLATCLSAAGPARRGPRVPSLQSQSPAPTHRHALVLRNCGAQSREPLRPIF